MEKREVNKRILRDKTCDTCHHNVSSGCDKTLTMRGILFAIPKNHTCEQWEPIDTEDAMYEAISEEIINEIDKKYSKAK